MTISKTVELFALAVNPYIVVIIATIAGLGWLWRFRTKTVPIKLPPAYMLFAMTGWITIAFDFLMILLGIFSPEIGAGMIRWALSILGINEICAHIFVARIRGKFFFSQPEG